ncbi:CooT family nickel-binding protein [Thermosediminibacter litoriperuensis]|uniref:Putative RNA-binding protein n=1 Tax=Thermosediminibacter litoriperuensis TaxID=291989 RepID=A0A5S5AZS3_9FIRM|nr:CooT family nickel-binding protein [Thermosediminibacter litoriperuensis]TYP57874.1 putative RNA-binding protein [Thermosediminibacter litoriperuensis]
MCESKVYLLENGKEREIMENVVYIEPQDGRVFMYSLLGEQKILDAVIKEVKLLEHKIILESRKDKK